MQDGRKAVGSIPYVFLASFFPSLKQNFIAYRFSKVSWRPDCIFKIHQLWQSGFGRVYSNCCCRRSFELEIIKVNQSSPEMYSNNILNFQVSTSILSTCTKSSGNLLNAHVLKKKCPLYAIKYSIWSFYFLQMIIIDFLKSYIVSIAIIPKSILIWE